MPITQSEVIKLAKLARLSIKPEALPKLASDLDKVIGYVTKLQTIAATKSISESSESVRLRPDEIESFADMPSLIKAAPEHEGDMICTPPIFSKRL